MRHSTKFLSALAVAGLIAASGSAFTAGNTIAASNAGSGATVISPYTTSNIQYDANDTNPQNLDAVTFTLNDVARYVAIRTHDAGSWFKSDDNRLTSGTVDSCTTSDQLTWTCNVTGATPNETVAGAVNLSVVATD